MALAQTLIDKIRDEIGTDQDFTDSDLEDIFTDSTRGGSSVLRTAWVVWKRRLNALQERSFDIATEGSLLSRRQKVTYMQDRVHELARIVDETYTGRNQSVQSPLVVEEAAWTYGIGIGTTEF